jgi:prophage regulatory protein
MNSRSESRLNIEEKQINALDGEMVKQINDGEAGEKRGFLRLSQVIEIIPISKSSWWKRIREGRFPKPVKLSERTSAWLRADIDALCDQFAVKATLGLEKQLP